MHDTNPSDAARRKARAKAALDGLTDPPRGMVLQAGPASAYLGVSLSTFRRLDKVGELPAAVRITPGRVGWRVADLDHWLEARRVGPGRAAAELIVVAPRPVVPGVARQRRGVR